MISLNFVNYLTLISKNMWEGLCTRSTDRQTCTFGNQNHIMRRSNFKLPMFYHKYANATQVSLHKSFQQKAENMEKYTK